MTIRYPKCHFLLVVHRNRDSISTVFLIFSPPKNWRAQADARTNTQVKRYVHQFHSVHLADLKIMFYYNYIRLVIITINWYSCIAVMKVPLGGACAQSSMCNTTGAECRRGRCICPPDYYYIDDQCSTSLLVVVNNNNNNNNLSVV